MRKLALCKLPLKLFVTLVPYFVCDLLHVAFLVAAADEEPDEEQEEEQQQDGTYHRPDNDTHLVSSWKRRREALRSNKCSFLSLQS